ncbi:unnamed protein product [Caenorhabditis sp. 36 PRJEB53466]|nr:unnamed protein product [Caenorhabditis sp. 36 PRJEB53466]
MVAYKLTYFEGRGAAEVSRQILAYAGQKYEDKRVTREQWPALKASNPPPFGQLPLLEVDGKPLAQSHAIARFLAREFKLNGKTAWEEAQVNSLADQVKDYFNEIRPFLAVKMGFVTEGDVDALYKDVFLPALKKNSQFFTNFLKANNSGFLVGDSLTWVDLVIAQQTADFSGLGADLFNEFPELKAHSAKIQSIPQIKKWVQTRPVTKF